MLLREEFMYLDGARPVPDLDVVVAVVVVTVGALPLLRRVIVTLPGPAPITAQIQVT